MPAFFARPGFLAGAIASLITSFVLVARLERVGAPWPVGGATRHGRCPGCGRTGILVIAAYAVFTASVPMSAYAISPDPRLLAALGAAAAAVLAVRVAFARRAGAGVVAATDAVLGHRVVLIGLLIIGPCCVLLTGRWAPTMLTGLWVIGMAVVLGLPDDIWATATHLVFLGAVAVVALANTRSVAPARQPPRPPRRSPRASRAAPGRVGRQDGAGTGRPLLYASVVAVGATFAGPGGRPPRRHGWPASVAAGCKPGTRGTAARCGGGGGGRGR